eukprot:TRINITY_DN28440_c0_g1_i4.p1 TRINITY_DN28440_c0_g1~~TRINITY_DN28440_c0_g1_i4.p1  ORF type:complete len:490 (+),score=123.79 TRINITY_DN28440_c0_g1_i4:40-1509(+)
MFASRSSLGPRLSPMATSALHCAGGRTRLTALIVSLLCHVAVCWQIQLEELEVDAPLASSPSSQVQQRISVAVTSGGAPRPLSLLQETASGAVDELVQEQLQASSEVEEAEYEDAQVMEANRGPDATAKGGAREDDGNSSTGKIVKAVKKVTKADNQTKDDKVDADAKADKAEKNTRNDSAKVEKADANANKSHKQPTDSGAKTDTTNDKADEKDNAEVDNTDTKSEKPDEQTADADAKEAAPKVEKVDAKAKKTNRQTADDSAKTDTTNDQADEKDNAEVDNTDTKSEKPDEQTADADAKEAAPKVEKVDAKAKKTNRQTADDSAKTDTTNDQADEKDNAEVDNTDTTTEKPDEQPADADVEEAIPEAEKVDKQSSGDSSEVATGAVIAPFGKEDTARELQLHAARTQDTLVDAVENAEVAEIKRAVFRALTRLRAAEIKEFDTIARLETQAIDEYNDNHHYRQENPLDYIHSTEPKVKEDKLTSFHE